MPNVNNTKLVEYLRTTWGKQDATDVVEEISKGKYLPTQAFLIAGGQPQNGHEDKEDYRTSLVKAGAIDRILELLLRSNENFEKVLPGAGDDNLVQCPSIWLQVVSCVCRDGFLKPPSLQEEIQFKVVNNIQGVFQDVSAFEKRKLFGSRDCWIRSLLYFLAMLRNLLTSENPKMANFLMKVPPLKLFLVRMVYMELGGIPKEALQDVQEFETTHQMKVIGFCQSYAAFTIKIVTEKIGAAAAANQKKKIAKDKSKSKSMTQNFTNALLGEFAVMPIGPGQELMFGPGIPKLLESSNSDGWYEGGYSSTMFLFLKLYDWGGRLSGKFGVDCVSSSLVPICRNYLIEYAPTKRNANNYFLENVCTGLVVLGASLVTPVDAKGRQAPIDYNVASAIYSGLLEYCCDICDACNDGRFVAPLTKFLHIVFVMAKFPLTRKALRSKSSEIRSKIERVKERLPYLFSCLPIIEKIVDAAVLSEDNEKDKIEEIIKCEFCNEKCGKDGTAQKKKCSFCKSVVYCSSDCLRLNHILHQQSCLVLRKYPAPKSSSAQIVQNGKELFATHLQKILLQASLKGFSILFCFVVIDMAEATPVFRTLTQEQFLLNYSILEEDVIEKAKATFERNKADGSLTVSMIGFFEEGLSISVLTFPPDTAPTHNDFGPSVTQAFETDKWTAAQRQVAQTAFPPGAVKKLQSNPQMWKASILKSMKP